MAEQKDSANVRFHLYKNNEYDNPAYSYKPETDSAGNKVHKGHVRL